jgi:transposase
VFNLIEEHPCDEDEMTQGNTPTTQGLFNLGRDHCERTLRERSIYRLLYEHGDSLFPDDLFADLYSGRGRHSVPPRIVATVMVLQRLLGLSDREAVERFAYDARWQYAAGGLEADYGGFGHTVLVNMRARLRQSEAPTRIFEAVLCVAKDAGLVGARRVLDSTPLYDAVATQDTVTLIRSAIRGVLRVCDEPTAAKLRGVLHRDDDYDSPGKPACAWDDSEARTQLVDALARDGYAVLAHFDGETLGDELQQALELLATVLGQDLEQNQEGTFCIARGVAKDRVISTVDPEARHGHKSSARGFDGYKGHIAIDPDSEIITATAVTAGNTADGEPVEELVADMLPPKSATSRHSESAAPSSGPETLTPTSVAPSQVAPKAPLTPDESPTQPTSTASPSDPGNTDEEAGEPSSTNELATPARYESARRAVLDVSARLRDFLVTVGVLVGILDCPNPAVIGATEIPEADEKQPGPQPPIFRLQPTVYGDCAYGTAKILSMLDAASIKAMTKTQPLASRKGCFAQDKFAIDLAAGTAVCPAGKTAQIKHRKEGTHIAKFGRACEACALREQCTSAKTGRTLNIHGQHDVLQEHRKRQQADAWQADYKATRPKVERKIGHMMRRRHGGRRARVRGRLRVDHDFSLLAAAVNLARLAKLGVTLDNDTWVPQPT